MNFLPNIGDPAGSPRVIAEPRDNPYIPKGMRQRASMKPVHRMIDPRVATEEQLVPVPPHEPPRPRSLKARIHPSGAQTARPAAVEPSLHSPRRAPTAASLSARGSASHSMSDAQAQHMEKLKRLERLQDTYHAAFSREELLSEQYDRELLQVKEALQKLSASAPAEKMKAEARAALRNRSKLEKRVGGFEVKLNELETYNEKLVAMISGLRKQNEPNRNGMKAMQAQIDKLGADMTQLKAACHKSLDERERSVDQLRKAMEEQVREEGEFDAYVAILKGESDEYDRKNRDSEGKLEFVQEQRKRQQYVAMRDARRKREALEVRYGYLRSQLEGIDNDFRELQRIVGVHFTPTRPESLQAIIHKFVERENQIVSLEAYWDTQNREMQGLSLDIDALQKAADTAKLESENAAPAARGGRKLFDETVVAKLEALFGELSKLVEAMFREARCHEDVDGGGASLSTKGCSATTLLDYIACVEAQIDKANRDAANLREVASSHRSTSSRRPNEALEGFLGSRRTAPEPARATDADAASGDAADKPSAEESMANRNALARRALKEELPSLNDWGPEAEGDAEPSARQQPVTKKGAIDKAKRDESISAWAQRQNDVRLAKRATIRDYYDDGHAQWPQRAVYPPASAR